MKTKIIRKAEDIGLKKKSIIEKIAQHLKNKYNSLFKEKGYTLEDLKIDLSLIIKEKDLVKFDYSSFILKIEKSILENLSKMETKLIKNIPKLDNIDKLTNNGKYSSVDKLNLLNENNNNKNQIIKTDSSNNPNSKNNDILSDLTSLERNNNKLKALEDKSKNEWALLAKLDYKKFLDDKKSKIEKENENKSQVKSMLEDQIKLRELNKLKEKEETMKFVKIQEEMILKQESLEKNKQDLLKQKMQEQKWMREQQLKEANNRKNEKMKIEKASDKNFIERINNEQKRKELEIVKKKQEEKEMYKNIIQENERREAIKKQEKELIKDENKKALELYSQQLEKQELARQVDMNDRWKKINGNLKNYEIQIKKNNENNKIYEERKFLKELEEKEKK